MSGSVTYSVLTAGGVVEGHDPENVIAEFCKLFNIDADKAAVYIEKQKLIKKNLTQAQAKAYQEQFTKMGVPVTVKKIMPVKPDDFGGLSLTPANDPQTEQDDQADTAAATGATNAKPKGFSCPKCEKEQEKSDTCISCGIIFEKYEAALARVKEITSKPAPAKPTNNAAMQRTARVAAEANTDTDSDFDKDTNTVACVIAAVVIAIVGAFIWKTIAFSTGREFGLLAWVIGGAIGMGAAFFGADDTTEGIICAVICVLAIAGGKYMIAGDFVDMFSGEDADFQAELVNVIQEEFGDDVEAFAAVGDDEKSIKQFMVEYGYSEGTSYQSVGEDEYQGFVEYSMPMLRAIHENPDGLGSSEVFNDVFFGGEDYSDEDWADDDTEDQLFTQGEMFKEMWRPLDLIFLIFGALTAYQMANGRGAELLGKA